MKQKTALVTGSEGFIGRHLVPELSKLGYRVHQVDPKLNYGFETVIADVKRGRGEVFDVVYHLAANIEDVDTRFKQGHEAYKDILLDYAMAEYIAKYPPREAFIWPTSCATDNPSDPYAWVKLTGERVFGALRKHCRVVMLRPFSGYGSDQALSYPFPAILQRAIRHANPLRVWGSGNQVRDWVHVDDLIKAFIMAIDVFPDQCPVQIGTGMGVNFHDLAFEMARAVGYNPVILAETDKAESSPRRVADVKLARTYGWKPTITINEGIRRALREWSR